MLNYLRPITRPKGRPAISRSQRKTLQEADAARDGRLWPEAARLYRRYLIEVPGDSAIWTQLGHALKESGHPEDAEAAYRTGLAVAPQDAELHLQLGHVLKLQGRLGEAEKSYLQSSALDVTLGARAEIAWRTDKTEQPTVQPSSLDNHPVAQLKSRLDADALHRLAEGARDRRAFQEAAGHYRAFLDLLPDHGGVWVQYGHMLRDSGRFAEADRAYSTAIQLDAGDADAHFQLGHLLCLQNRKEEAFASFRRSLAIRVTASSVHGMFVNGFPVSYEEIPLEPVAAAKVYVEITDLITVITRSNTVSGIQRVQVNIIGQLVQREPDSAAVFWRNGLLWSLKPELLQQAIALFDVPRGLEHRQEVIDRMLAEARPVRPSSVDTFIITGAFWIRVDPASDHAKIKRGGTRLGAYIYDFIPLTTPEFVPQSAVDEFSNALAELMLQIDFALTISDFVGQEFKRLRREAGLPAISVETVPLAHELAATQQQAPETWVEATGGLRGKEFVLCVGSVSAHKNHILALQVWRLLLQKGIEPPLLVFAGRLGFGIHDLKDQLRTSFNLGGRVVIVENLDDAAIATLYRNCLFTLFPSFVEGWGLPVGESLAFGKVCLASGTTSIPEVGGNFVTVIDPYNARKTADQVAELLADRSLLQRAEARIRSHFKPRSWDEFGVLFTTALKTASGVAGRNLVRLPASQVLQPRAVLGHWQHGMSLPSPELTATRLLMRNCLVSGWHPLETWGCWMDGAEATLTVPTARPAGAAVRIILQGSSVQWMRSDRLTVIAGTGERVSLQVPSRGRKFIVLLDCVTGIDGVVQLRLQVAGSLRSVAGEPRSLGIGLNRLMYLELDAQSERLPAGVLLRPTSLVGSSGNIVHPQGRDALVEAARRISVLTEGWLHPENWGTWMEGRAARFALRPDAPVHARVRLILRLRSTAPSGGTVTVTTHDGRSTTIALPQGTFAETIAAIDCKVDAGGYIGATLRVSPADGRVGLTAVAWGQLGEEMDRVALLESVLLGSSERETNDTELVSRDATFIVAGHLAGTYSLAAVNRRLATALDAVLPGRVQVAQVEGHLRHDIEGVVGEEGARFRTFAYHGRTGNSPQVVISQHWPVQPPPVTGDLALAYVFWEESVVPRDVVRTLNQHYHGVLAPSLSVVKALIDSGVRVPVRLVGYAPDLSRFASIAEARARSVRRPPAPGREFTFLHVSSCFPRKGVDVLLAAYAMAFTRHDPVRLVIKGFSNPHNDVAAQVARLRETNAELAPVDLIDSDLPQSALLDLYRDADCMVLPTRGEGFNIPAAEAMAAGLPLIVTGIGGHADFTDQGEARLLGYRFTHSLSHLRTSNSVWGEPSVDDLCAAMQEALRAPPQTTDLATARAKRVGDPFAWAEQIRSVASELLSFGVRPRPKIAWVSTWMIRCGIGEYSRMLLEAYPSVEQDVTVLCDIRTDNNSLSISTIPVRKAWACQDAESLDGLAAAIQEIDAAVVVIQHHHGLVAWAHLPLLLEDWRVRTRQVVATLHNTQQIYDEDFSTRVRLFAALSTISRIFVHTVADLNLLKQEGLIDNVSLIPHGALVSTLAPKPARALSSSDEVIIGSYGFFLPPKGFDRLIEAFVTVRRQFPRARLRLVTAEYPQLVSAQMIERCRALAERLDLTTSIDWHTSYLANDESLRLLYDCDLVVLPYQETREASSAAVRTALSAQVPIAVTPLPIFEELGNAVLRLHDTDVNSIANGILWLLSEQTVREDLMHAARRWLEDNSWTNVAERWSGVLQGLVAAIPD